MFNSGANEIKLYSATLNYHQWNDTVLPSTIHFHWIHLDCASVNFPTCDKAIQCIVHNEYWVAVRSLVNIKKTSPCKCHSALLCHRFRPFSSFLCHYFFWVVLLLNWDFNDLEKPTNKRYSVSIFMRGKNDRIIWEGIVILWLSKDNTISLWLTWHIWIASQNRAYILQHFQIHPVYPRLEVQYFTLMRKWQKTWGATISR